MSDGSCTGAPPVAGAGSGREIGAQVDLDADDPGRRKHLGRGNPEQGGNVRGDVGIPCAVVHGGRCDRPGRQLAELGEAAGREGLQDFLGPRRDAGAVGHRDGLEGLVIGRAAAWRSAPALALAAVVAADASGAAVGSVRSTSLRMAAKSCEARGFGQLQPVGSLTAGTVGTATNATLPTSMFLSRLPTASSVGIGRQAVVDREVLGDRVGDPEHPGRVGQGALVLDLAGQRGQEALLRLDPAQVPAVAEGVPGADEGKRLLPLDGGRALGQPQLRIRVVDGVADAHFHAAHGVGELLDRIEVGHHEVVDFHAGELVDRVHGAADPGLGHRGVDHDVFLRRVLGAGLRVRALRDVDEQVAGEADDIDAFVVRRDVQQHHDIGMPVPGGVVGAAVLRVFPVAGVRAEDQDLHAVRRIVDRALGLGAAGSQRRRGEVALQPDRPSRPRRR